MILIVIIISIVLIYLYVNYNKKEEFTSEPRMIQFPNGYDTETIWMENRNYVPFIENKCLDTFIKKDPETCMKVCRTCKLGEMGVHIV